MYRIGEFAKRNNVSIHTLRYYDNLGILRAQKKDEDSSFRYYTDKDEKILKNIHILQSFGFSIDDIAHFSKEVVERKIEEISNRANYLIRNICFLQNLMWEENMEELDLNEIMNKTVGRNFTISPRGQWECEGEAENWIAIVSHDIHSIKDKNMEQLYFGVKNEVIKLVCNLAETTFVNTVLQEFVLGKEKYVYFTYRDKLILCKKVGGKELFYCYRNVDERCYSEDDLNELTKRYTEKRQPLSDIKDKEKFERLLGEWEYQGCIKEKDISEYNTPVHNDRAGIGPWKPHYCYLRFFNDKTVQTMKDGEEFSIDGKVFTPRNTMAHFNDEKMDTIFKNPTKLSLFIKRIKGEEYLFVLADDALHSTTLNDNYWFYTRKK